MRLCFIVLIFTALLVYIAFVLFMFQNQRKIMYQPILEKSFIQNSNNKNIQIINVKTDDGVDLEGWYVPPERVDDKIIVFFHGNGQNMWSSYSGVSRLLEHGYGLLMVEYRGYAGHDGEFTEQGVYKDSRAFINWLLHSQKIETSKIILYGESLGSAAAVQMASEYGGNALVLLAPFSSILEIASRQYPFIPVKYLLKDRYMNIDKIDAINNTPLLILHGKKDQTIPLSSAKRLFEQAKEPKKFITFPQANHSNLYDFGASQHVLDFLASIEVKNNK